MIPLSTQAQKEYVIRTFYDLMQALREHPDWLEEIRNLILTTEFFELPKKIDELIKKFETFREKEFRPLKEGFEEFREKEFKPLKEGFEEFHEKEFKPLKEGFEEFHEKEFKPLKEKVDRVEEKVESIKEEFETFREKEFKPLKEKVDKIEGDVEVLKEDVEILKKDVKYLKEDVRYLKNEVADLKGDNFERKVRERYFLFFGKLLKKARLISQEELFDRVSEAEDKGLISEEEYEDIARVDVILEGLLKHNRRPVVLAVEVTVSLYPEDIERAFKRAGALFKVFQKEAIPVVVFKRGKEELEEMALEKGVLLIRAPE